MLILDDEPRRFDLLLFARHPAQLGNETIRPALKLRQIFAWNPELIRNHRKGQWNTELAQYRKATVLNEAGDEVVGDLLNVWLELVDTPGRERLVDQAAESLVFRRVGGEHRVDVGVPLTLDVPQFLVLRRFSRHRLTEAIRKVFVALECFMNQLVRRHQHQVRVWVAIDGCITDQHAIELERRLKHRRIERVEVPKHLR